MRATHCPYVVGRPVALERACSDADPTGDDRLEMSDSWLLLDVAAVGGFANGAGPAGAGARATVRLAASAGAAPSSGERGKAPVSREWAASAADTSRGEPCRLSAPALLPP